MNNPQVIKLLLDEGADVNAKNQDGKTALMICRPVTTKSPPKSSSYY